jgi:dolichol-phosphate mannosyltransferase
MFVILGAKIRFMSKPLISYVLPVYNEDKCIERFLTSLQKTLQPLEKKYAFELICINDGSQDGSLEILTRLAQKHDEIVVLDLSRNYGHQVAVTAGIDYSTGQAVIIMDTDLQDPPAVSVELIQTWEKGFDVVYAQRASRKDSAFKKLTASIYYRTLDLLSEIKIPRDTGDFRLMDAKVVTELRKFREHNRYIRGLVSYVGFKQTAVLFERDKRYGGTTGYPLGKMIRFAMDGVTGFSTVPLQLISQLGFLVSGMSFLGALYALIIRLQYTEAAVPGWAFITIAIFFIGGIQMITLGVIGSYVGRIYKEVQNRPLYSIADTINDKKLSDR